MISQPELYNMVVDIMQREPRARRKDNRRFIIWYVWGRLGLLNENSTISLDKFVNEDTPSPETITRVARAVIQKFPNWRDPASDKAQQEYRSRYSKYQEA